MAGTILIVDDHDVFRSRAGRMLQADGFQIVGEAGDIATGVRATGELTPDIVLLDIHLPDGNGLEQVDQFAAASPNSRIVIVSTYDAEDAGDLARRGVSGFISKAELSGEAVSAAIEGPTPVP